MISRVSGGGFPPYFALSLAKSLIRPHQTARTGRTQGTLKSPIPVWLGGDGHNHSESYTQECHACRLHVESVAFLENDGEGLEREIQDAKDESSPEIEISDKICEVFWGAYQIFRSKAIRSNNINSGLTC